MQAAVSTPRRGRLDQFRDLVHQETGIRLPPSKDVMIASRLRKRLIALEMPSIDHYLSHLFDDDGLDNELPEIIDLLTTNKTDFFREQAHYRLLKERIIPEALARTRAGQATKFRFWSAAASTGAEAWSAAMVLAQAASVDKRLDWRILGTDISTRVLDIARTAIYPVSEFHPIPPELRSTYIMTGKGEDGLRGRIVPELRARVRFAEMNLIETPYRIDHGLDVAFLRNVLIYFEPALQNRVVRAVAAHLRPGGYLVVGHAESMIVRVPGLHAVAPGVYRNEERR
ncbi:chemotaxis protein CheR [Cereibacter sphaeroides]|nr:chemotaxis protein CheR [Cereibacter sphaeroides]